MLKYFAFILCLSFVLPIQATAKGNDKLAVFKKDNYTIQYPTAWRVSESGNMGTEFFLIVPLENQADGFAEHISLTIETQKSKTENLTSFAKDSERKIKSYVTGSKIISSKSATYKRVKYHRLEYTGAFKEDTLRWVAYYFLKDKKVYVLTAVMMDDEKENYIDTLEKAMKTFKLN